MREATREEHEILSELHGTIVARGDRNALRSRFVEAEERLRETGFTIPPGMERLQVALNWPSKVVSSFAARQRPEFFTTRTETPLLSEVEDVYADNNFFAVERWAIEAADQHGCSFVFVSRGDTSVGEPEFVLSARTALTATAVLDPRSRRVTAAMELIGGARVVLHLPGRVLTCVRRPSGWWVEDEVSLGTSMVLCAPFVHGGSLEKPLGRSRVTNTVMALTYAGARTLLRQEVAAEFFAAPRMLLMGTDSSVFTDPKTGKELSPLEILTGAVWAIPDVDPSDADQFGIPDALQRAGVHQVSQMSMQPYSDEYRLLASILSGAASIPLQYMGVVSDSNPASAAAIEASEVDLINEVKAQLPGLGAGRRLLAMAILHAIHGDLDEAARADLRSLRARWEDPRTRSMSEQSQMTALQVQSGNMQPGTRTTLRQLPLSQEDIEAAVAENERAAGGSIFEQLMSGEGGAEQAPADETKLSERANTFGILIRSGATPESAARVAAGEIAISDVVMRPGAVPVTLRDGLVE